MRVEDKSGRLDSRKVGALGISVSQGEQREEEERCDDSEW